MLDTEREDFAFISLAFTVCVDKQHKPIVHSAETGGGVSRYKLRGSGKGPEALLYCTYFCICQ